MESVQFEVDFLWVIYQTSFFELFIHIMYIYVYIYMNVHQENNDVWSTEDLTWRFITI